MEKSKLGWLVNAGLGAGAIITAATTKDPNVAMGAIAGATIAGVAQSVFTIVESNDEKENREFESFLNVGSAEINSDPVEVYEKLRSSSSQAHFTGDHEKYEYDDMLSGEQLDEEMTL